MQQKSTNDGEGKKVDSEEKCGKQETNRDLMSKNVQISKETRKSGERWKKWEMRGKCANKGGEKRWKLWENVAKCVKT